MLALKSRAQQRNWLISDRYKVNETVIHQNYYWVNVTGANSEPSTASDDWVRGSTVSGAGEIFNIKEVYMDPNSPDCSLGQKVAGSKIGINEDAFFMGRISNFPHTTSADIDFEFQL